MKWISLSLYLSRSLLLLPVPFFIHNWDVLSFYPAAVTNSRPIATAYYFFVHSCFLSERGSAWTGEPTVPFNSLFSSFDSLEPVSQRVFSLCVLWYVHEPGQEGKQEEVQSRMSCYYRTSKIIIVPRAKNSIDAAHPKSGRMFEVSAQISRLCSCNVHHRFLFLIHLVYLPSVPLLSAANKSLVMLVFRCVGLIFGGSTTGNRPN